MPDLSFQIESAEAVAFAAVPQLAFKLRLHNADAQQVIHTVALRCQIQIEVTRRRYAPEEQEQLTDLFGAPDRWSQTLRSMLWTHVSGVVPTFQGSSVADLLVPCTFDFNVAATKYFQGLSDGDIPLCFLFSGTVFYGDGEHPLQVAPISWEKESRYKLPVKVWRDMMDLYYPNSAWLQLQRDVFERLYQYKMRRGFPTWEEAIESVLPVEEQVEP